MIKRFSGLMMKYNIVFELVCKNVPLKTYKHWGWLNLFLNPIRNIVSRVNFTQIVWPLIMLAWLTSITAMAFCIILLFVLRLIDINTRFIPRLNFSVLLSLITWTNKLKSTKHFLTNDNGKINIIKALPHLATLQN